MTPHLPIKSAPERLHRVYVQETCMELDFSMSRLWAWELWSAKFSEQDLRDVIRFNKSKGNRGRNLNFRNLISGPCAIEFAEEDLAELRAKRRAPIVTNRDKVLAASGRPQEKVSVVKMAAQVMADTKALAEFRAWKEANL